MFVEIHEGRRGADRLRIMVYAYETHEYFRAFLRGRAYNPMQPVTRSGAGR